MVDPRDNVALMNSPEGNVSSKTLECCAQSALHDSAGGSQKGKGESCEPGGLREEKWHSAGGRGEAPSGSPVSTGEGERSPPAPVPTLRAGPPWPAHRQQR